MFIYMLWLFFRTMEYLEEVAVNTARQLATGQLKVDRTKKGLVDKIMNMALKYDFVKDQIFSKAKGQVMKMTGGLYPAPLKVKAINILIPSNHLYPLS